MMERDELLERLLEMKGKVPLSASDWKLINQALADPTLKKDLELLELLDTLEDESRLQASDDAAFNKFQIKLNRAQEKKTVDRNSLNRKSGLSWWFELTRPRRPWGLPIVIAQLALVAVYFNLGDDQIKTEERLEIYRSFEQFESCEVIRVKFKPNMTIGEISDVLKKAGLSFASGPFEGDQYLISRGSYSLLDLKDIFDPIAVLDTNNCR